MHLGPPGMAARSGAGRSCGLSPMPAIIRCDERIARRARASSPAPSFSDTKMRAPSGKLPDWLRGRPAASRSCATRPSGTWRASRSASGPENSRRRIRNLVSPGPAHSGVSAARGDAPVNANARKPRQASRRGAGFKLTVPGSAGWVWAERIPARPTRGHGQVARAACWHMPLRFRPPDGLLKQVSATSVRSSKKRSFAALSESVMLRKQLHRRSPTKQRRFASSPTAPTVTPTALELSRSGASGCNASAN